MPGYKRQDPRGKRDAAPSFPLPNSPFPLQKGFTLIEMIMVIVLIGAMVAVASVFIVQPFRAFDDMQRRAELVEAADSALMLMTREVRAALPNSVRVQVDGGRVALEFIPTVAGGRYRAHKDGTGDGDILDFTQADDGFDVMGEIDLPAVGRPEVVVYNLTASGSAGNAYLGDNRASLDAAASTATHVSLISSHQFPFASPDQRFQIVTAPVAYVCDPAGGELRRVEGYGFGGNPFTVSGALAARYVTGCQFDYDPGAGTRNGLVSARLTLSDAGETISLLQQVHVLNTP